MSRCYAVTVALEYECGNDISWKIERLDVEQDLAVIYESVPDDTYTEVNDVPNQLLKTVLLDEGGVYRFLLVEIPSS